MKRKNSMPLAELKKLLEELQCPMRAYAEWIGIAPATGYAWTSQDRVPVYAILLARLLLGHDVGRPAKWKERWSAKDWIESSTFAERNAEMCRLLQEGRTLEAIGAQFDVTRERVRQICERAGVVSTAHIRAAEKQAAKAAERQARRERQHELKARCLQLMQDGLSAQEAAFAVGVTAYYALQWAGEAGFKLKRGYRKGSRRFTDYNASQITILRSQGKSVTEIAREIGARSPMALRAWCRNNKVPLVEARP